MFTTITLLAHMVFTAVSFVIVNAIASWRIPLRTCLAYGAAIGLLLSTISLLP